MKERKQLTSVKAEIERHKTNAYASVCCHLSGHCGDEDWTSAAHVEKERRLLVRVKRARTDVVQATGNVEQLEVDVTAPAQHATSSK